MVIMSQVACIILSFKMHIGKKIENCFGCGKKISEEKNFLSFLFMIAYVIIKFSVNEIMHLLFKIVVKYIEMIIYLCLKS